MSKEKQHSPEAKGKMMAADNPDYITPKQQAFIMHYLANNQNATQAAIMAGYSPRSAASTASEMLKMDKIKKRIEGEKQQQMDRLALDGDWIISRFMKLAESDTEATKLRALENLGKVVGIYAPDKQQIETINGGDFLATLDLSDDEETMQ